MSGGTVPARSGGLVRRAARGVMWATVDNWGRQIVSLTVLLIMARLLTPTEFGLFGIVVVVQTLMLVVLDEGIGESILQKQVIEPAHIDSAFWLNLAGALVTMLAGIAAAGMIAGWFQQPQLEPLIVVMSLSLIPGALGSIQQALLRRSFAYDALAMRSILGVVSGGVIAVLFAWHGAGVWSLVAQLMTEKIVGSVVLWWRSPWRPGLRWSHRHVRDLLPYASKIILSRALFFGYKQMDRFIVGLFLGPAVLGAYTLAHRIYDTVVALLLQACNNVAFSAFAQLSPDVTRLRTAYYQVTETISLAAFPAFIGLSLLAPDAVQLVFGADWQLAGTLLQVISLSGIPALSGSFVNTLMRANGRPGLFLAVAAAATAGNIVLVLSVISYGAVAAAWALVARAFAFMPIEYVILRQLLGVRLGEYIALYAPATAAAGAMALGVILVRVAFPSYHTHLALAAEIAGGAAVYGLMLLIFGKSALSRAAQMVKALRPAS
jgi:PST family polysaccharide transporter